MEFPDLVFAMNGRVVRGIQRPDAELTRRFAKAGSAMASEAMGRGNTLSSTLRPIQQGAAIAGPAITIQPAYGDNFMVHVAIELCQAGDVIVIAPPRPDSNAYFGEMMAVSAQAIGCAGVVVDAGIRDTAALRSMGFPAWASAICPAGTERRALGDVNAAINCGGQHICPGDIIVADDDGICCVPQAGAESVMGRIQKKLDAEETIRRRLAAGEAGLDVYALREELAALGIHYE